MNSSEPMYPIVLGREGLLSSQVSRTMVLRKSIQRLSAADKASAVLREDEVMLMVVSSSCVDGYGLQTNMLFRCFLR